MLTEQGTMTTSAVFSEDRQYRYLLKKEWDKKKPKATIIMINPSTADINLLDQTTLYILNNLIKLDFGSVEIVNLIPKCTIKLNSKMITTKLDAENLSQILLSSKEADTIILAWGKLGENNSRIKKLEISILQHLVPYTKKLFTIGDGKGRTGFHPLAPQIRFQWHLNPIKE